MNEYEKIETYHRNNEFIVASFEHRVKKTAAGAAVFGFSRFTGVESIWNP